MEVVSCQFGQAIAATARKKALMVRGVEAVEDWRAVAEVGARAVGAWALVEKVRTMEESVLRPAARVMRMALQAN